MSVPAHWPVPPERCPSQHSLLLLKAFPSVGTTWSQCGAAIGSEQRKTSSVPTYPKGHPRHPENVFWGMGTSSDNLEHGVAFRGSSVGGSNQRAGLCPIAAYTEVEAWCCWVGFPPSLCCSFPLVG